MGIFKDFPKKIVPCLGWQNHGPGRNPVTVSTWDVENPGKKSWDFYRMRKPDVYHISWLADFFHQWWCSKQNDPRKKIRKRGDVPSLKLTVRSIPTIPFLCKLAVSFREVKVALGTSCFMKRPLVRHAGGCHL